ncbi:cob(I)yrinic acid a,c-diamide adenosyltransferase [Patescibacteria group bacterium]|nr:cob(I)yrinic acid a,c-diamide adenosyltransferase [Patescibacteria group bacterium]MBU1885661.1 cob(I)yrinic acid a,c-diamide adenosyltransferase [Patescibacteria group bacterium]
MNSISTKTGDCGQTSLANGQRVAKDSLVMEVIGTLDELNSWIGLVIACIPVIVDAKNDSITQKKVLEQIQQDLYQLSAVIVQAPQVKFKKPALNRLEKQSELLQTTMVGNWHDKFLHPGGTKLAAQLDIARTVCRRCERLIFKYAKQKVVPALILQYLNRLSDYLYVLRCYINLDQKYSEKQFILDK